MGKQLGDAVDPLLVSVRSGAPFSMPGMMDTVLNLGLNDDSVGGPRQADRQRALRVRLVPPLRADVRQDRARRPRRRCSKSALARRCVEERGRRRSTPSSRPTTSQGSSTTFKGIVQRGGGHRRSPTTRTEQLRLRDRGRVQVVERRARARLPPHGEDPRRPRHRGQRADDGVRQQGRRLRHRRRVHAQPVDR